MCVFGLVRRIAATLQQKACVSWNGRVEHGDEAHKDRSISGAEVVTQTAVLLVAPVTGC